MEKHLKSWTLLSKFNSGQSTERLLHLSDHSERGNF